MTKQNQVYQCSICGNITEVLHESTGTLSCCGQSMNLLEENSVDAAVEKHVPEARKKILLGVMPLASAKTVTFLNRLPGITVPDEVSKRVTDAENPLGEGVMIAVDLVDKARDLGLAGVHVMPVSGVKVLEKVFENLK